MDILHNDGELLFADGDLVTGQSNQQHVEDIIVSQKGEWKEHLLCGFGAINYIKSRITSSEFKRDLKVQLAYDKYPDTTIDFSASGVLNVEINK